MKPLRLLFLTAMCVALPIWVAAQPGLQPQPPPDDVPLSGGMVFLLVAGLVFTLQTLINQPKSPK